MPEHSVSACKTVRLWMDTNYGAIALEAAQPGTDFAKATTSFRAIMPIDIAVRHPESFILSSKS